MSGAAGMETSQLSPLDHDSAQQRRAAIACADYAQRRDLDDGELLELLRALGLADDPWALDRDPLYSNKLAPEQR